MEYAVSSKAYGLNLSDGHSSNKVSPSHGLADVSIIDLKMHFHALIGALINRRRLKETCMHFVHSWKLISLIFKITDFLWIQSRKQGNFLQLCIFVIVFFSNCDKIKVKIVLSNIKRPSYRFFMESIDKKGQLFEAVHFVIVFFFL